MAVEQLELREDATLLGEIRDELVPKQMQIDPLLDTCRLRVVFDDMAKASCRVQPTPIRFEEIRGAWARVKSSRLSMTACVSWRACQSAS
jgi:hypothetical protein